MESIGSHTCWEQRERSFPLGLQSQDLFFCQIKVCVYSELVYSAADEMMSCTAVLIDLLSCKSNGVLHEVLICVLSCSHHSLVWGIQRYLPGLPQAVRPRDHQTLPVRYCSARGAKWSRNSSSLSLSVLFQYYICFLSILHFKESLVQGYSLE